MATNLVLNQITRLDLSSNTSNELLTFPSGPKINDRCGYEIVTANTTAGASSFPGAPYWGAEPASGTSIIGSSYALPSGDGVNRWGIMLQYEKMVFVWVGDTWVPAYDGRRAMVCRAYRATNETLGDGSTHEIKLDTADDNPHGMHDSSNYRIYIKRQNPYYNTIAWYCSSSESVTAHNCYISWSSTTDTSRYIKTDTNATHTSVFVNRFQFARIRDAGEYARGHALLDTNVSDWTFAGGLATNHVSIAERPGVM